MAKIKARRSGLPLLVFLLPLLVIAIVCTAVIGLLAQQQTAQARVEANVNQLALVANFAAQSISERLALTQASLHRLARSKLLQQLANTPNSASTQQQLERIVQGDRHLLQLRLVNPAKAQRDLSGPAPLSYAGLELIEQAANTHQTTRAEVHMLQTQTPYLALAIPFTNAKGLATVLFAAIQLKEIALPLSDLNTVQGEIWLSQVVAGQKLFVKSVLGVRPNDLEQVDGSTNIAASTLTLNFRANAPIDAGGSGSVLLAAVLGMVLIVAAFVVALILLKGALRKDLASVLEVAETRLKGRKASERKPQLAELHDTIVLLGKLDAEKSEKADVAKAKKQKPKPNDSTQSTNEGAKAAKIEVKQNLSGPAQFGVDTAGLEVSEGVQAKPTQDKPAPEAKPADVPLEFSPHIFRAYDIRGIWGETLSPEIAHRLGHAVGDMAHEKGQRAILVARDARNSSEPLAESLIEGLRESGCGVIDLGMVPTPLLYFGTEFLDTNSGIVVTGSHNGPEYNGFKIVLDGEPLDEAGLAEVANRMQSGITPRTPGQRQRQDLAQDYVDHITNDLALGRPLKIVIDAGNGAAGPLAIELFEALGCEISTLYCEPDGDFPHHHPDPSQPDNLQDLSAEVQKQEADLGLAFDGDGDRLGVVDNEGRHIWPDRILMLLAGDILTRMPGSDVLYDVKCSRLLAGYVLAHGGRPVMWKSGHSRMKNKLKASNAPIAAEFTGHFFINERWFGFDDALYAAARLLELVAVDPRSSGDIFEELPENPSTPELFLPTQEGEAEQLLDKIRPQAKFKGARIIDTDGLRIEFTNGWGLIRVSNTSPALSFRFEADDDEGLEQVQEKFRALVTRAAPGLELPF